MARLGRTAKVFIGITAGLVLSAIAAAVLPSFFVVRRSPCRLGLKEISTAQRLFHADHNRYTSAFSQLEGVVLAPNSPYAYALDAGHPSGLTDGCPDCHFVATCRSDNPNRDVWSTSSVERSVRGETVPAFSIFHDINGE